MLTANSALALCYKALRVQPVQLAYKAQPAHRVPKGHKVQLVQLAHKAPTGDTGATGPQGPIGLTGPQGIGISTGAIIQLVQGSPTPAGGFTQIGTTQFQYHDLSGHNHVITLDVYQKN